MHSGPLPVVAQALRDDGIRIELLDFLVQDFVTTGRASVADVSLACEASELLALAARGNAHHGVAAVLPTEQARAVGPFWRRSDAAAAASAFASGPAHAARRRLSQALAPRSAQPALCEPPPRQVPVADLLETAFGMFPEGQGSAPKAISIKGNAAPLEANVQL